MSNIPVDTVLAVIGLALSVGGFVPIFFMHERKKEIAIAVVLATLLSISGIAVVRSYQHGADLKRAESSIVQKLGVEAKSFDQLYAEIKFCTLSTLNEALDNLVRNNIVGYRVKELYDENRKPLLVTVYFVNLNR